MKMNRTDAARVKKLNARVIELRNQIEDIEAPYRQLEAEAMVGLCFKTRNNYSCPEKPSDYWWRYVKVTRVGEHGSLYCLEFEVDKDGHAFVRRDDYHHPNSLSGYQTVSPDEFDREFSKMLKHIARCHAAATTKQEEGGAGGEVQPLNGIAATWQHDEGAYAQCSDCGRYTLDQRALSMASHACECGSVTGWSGSFTKPGPDAKWSGNHPASNPSGDGSQR